MFSENIEFIEKLVHDDTPEYGILSFCSDTFDLMKSHTYGTALNDEERAEFKAGMAKIVEGLKELDILFNSLESHKKK